MTPFGKPLTINQAAHKADRAVSTIYRWMQRELVRTNYVWDHQLGHSVLCVSETDVLAMRDRKWTRRRRT